MDKVNKLELVVSIGVLLILSGCAPQNNNMSNYQQQQIYQQQTYQQQNKHRSEMWVQQANHNAQMQQQKMQMQNTQSLQNYTNQLQSSGHLYGSSYKPYGY